ncbi:hypothetical protein ABIE86_005166 [Bradyrhizobium diazoefficiens]
MSIVRAIALFVILAFGGIVIAAGVMTSPASASKMDGKAGGWGGRNTAHYDAPKSGTAKPPTSAKKPPAQ